MRILLQFPEGLKKEAAKYVEKYENEGHEVFLSASPCYGGCDLSLDEARAINADKIVHFGHARFIKQRLPVEVEYVEYPINVNIKKFQNAAKKIKEKKIILVTTVQHVHQLKEMKSALESIGKVVYIGKGHRTTYKGQILGCDTAAAESIKHSDAIVYVGSGMFHPLCLPSCKSLYIIHPESGQLCDIIKQTEERTKKRKAMLAMALNATSFGILVSTKTGQFNLKGAIWVKEKLKQINKTGFILVANELSPYSLNNFMLFDCYITVACPRLSDDSQSFEKPVLDLSLFKELLRIVKK